MDPWPPALVAHYFKNALALHNATLHNVIEKCKVPKRGDEDPMLSKTGDGT